MAAVSEQRRTRWRALRQPHLAAVLSGLFVAVVMPSLFLSPGQRAASGAGLPESVVGSQTVSSGALPGQGTPRDIVLQAGPGTPAGDSRVVRMTIAGRERGYLLLPTLGPSTGGPRGLVVVLHQDIGSARAVSQGLGLDQLRRSGIALAYPAGVGGSWNAGLCCGVAQRQGVDDVAFVNAVLDDASRRSNVDSAHRALVGYSGGGMLAYRIMCSPHRPLAAVVEVSGSLEAPCGAGVTLPPLLSLHGELDGTVGLTKSIQVTHLGMAPRSVTSTLALVTEAAGCGARRTADGDSAEVISWVDCRGGSTIDVQIVRGAGHGWDDIGAAQRAVPYLLRRLRSVERGSSR